MNESPPHDHARPHRNTIKQTHATKRQSKDKQRSDALLRQQNARKDFKARARKIASRSNSRNEDIAFQNSSAEEEGEEEEEEEDLRNSKRSREIDDAEELGESLDLRPMKSKRRIIEEDGEEEGKKSSKAKKTFVRRRNSELQRAEWMTDIPNDLGENWFAQPRPRGTRCLVVSSKGYTQSYGMMNNRKMKGFRSALPGGSFETRGNQDSFCILDCVFYEKGNDCGDDDMMEEDGTTTTTNNSNSYYVVLDVMAWNGAETYGCDVEFRNFWLQSKFLGEIDRPHVARTSHEYPMFVAPMFTCNTLNDLKECYEGTRNAKTTFGFECDGMFFRDKRASYTPGETTPLMLVFKDAEICGGREKFEREFLDRGCLLKVKNQLTGELCAEDDDTTLLLLTTNMTTALTSYPQHSSSLKRGDCIKCEWVNMDDDNNNDKNCNNVGGGSLVPRMVVKAATKKKKPVVADLFSKIQFYIACKTNPLTIDEIANTIL
jgi:hypothetical protein